MKKLLSLAALLVVSSTAVAGFNGNTQQAGGFTGGSAGQVSTVAQALKASYDDMPIQLTGKIVSQISGDKFIFQDKTGQITIEIDDDHDVWQGQNISPNDTVTIYGKVDKETFKPNKVDVYRVQKH